MCPQLHARRPIQAARATDDQQTFDAGCFHTFDNRLAALQEYFVYFWFAPAGVVGSDHRVVTGHGLGHLGGVQHIGHHHRQAGLRRQSGRVAGQHSDLVTPAEQFGKNGSAYRTGARESKTDRLSGLVTGKVGSRRFYALRSLAAVSPLRAPALHGYWCCASSVPRDWAG